MGRELFNGRLDVVRSIGRDLRVLNRARPLPAAYVDRGPSEWCRLIDLRAQDLDAYVVMRQEMTFQRELLLGDGPSQWAWV